MSDFQKQRIERNIKKGTKRSFNMDVQYYKGIPLRLICRNTYRSDKAKRYAINETNQNVWIPNKHLEEDGTIKQGENLDYIFIKAAKMKKLKYAGVNSWSWQRR
jgi:hypothetical protein